MKTLIYIFTLRRSRISWRIGNYKNVLNKLSNYKSGNVVARFIGLFCTIIFSLLLLTTVDARSQYETSDKELFESASRFCIEENFDAAYSKFQELIKLFPKSSYIPQAYFTSALCLRNTEKAIKHWKKFIRKFPENPMVPSAMYYLAQVYFKYGNYSMAIDTFNKLLKKYPLHFLAWETLYGLGIVNLAIGDWVSAETNLYSYSLALTVENDAVNYSLGLVYYHQEKYNSALEKFKIVKSTFSVYYTGKCLEKLQEHIPAVAVFKEFLVKYPQSFLSDTVQFLIAECFYRIKEYSSAREEYQKLLISFPQTNLKTHALYKIACCHYRQKEYSLAISILKDLVKDYPNDYFAPLALYLVGESLLKQNDLLQAIQSYTLIINNYRHSIVAPQAYYKIGWCYNQQNSYKESIGMLSQFIDNFPTDNLLAQVLLLLADSYSKENKPEMAIQSYWKVLNIVPKNSPIAEAALFGIIKTYYEQKQYNQVITNYNYILNNFPPSTSEWRIQSYILIAEAHYHLGLYTEARKIYDFVSKNYPASHMAIYARDGKAWCYFQEKDYALAQKERENLLEDFSKEDTTSTTKTSSEFEIGKIYYNQKKYIDALDAFEKFIKAYPDNPSVPEAIYYTGRAYYRMEYYTKAIESWENLVNSYKDHKLASEAAHMIPDIYFRAQKYTQAISAYQRFINNYPDNPEVKLAYLRIAQSFYNAGDDQKAILSFEDFLSKYPDDPLTEDALEGVIISYSRQSEKTGTVERDTDALRALMGKIPKSLFTSELQYKIAERFYQKKDYTTAAEEFRKVLRDYPGCKKTPEAHFYMAESYYNAGNYTESARAYQSFVQNFPAHEFVVYSCLRWANSLFYLKDFEKAAEVYKRMLYLPEISEEIATTGFVNMALCYKKAEKFEEAILVYQNFYQKFPNHKMIKDMLLDMANIYEILKKYDLAVETYSKLLSKLTPEDETKIEIQYRIAEALRRDDKKDKAIEEWQKLRQMQPYDNSWRLSGLIKLAQEYENMGKYPEAINIYQDIANTSRNPEWVSAVKSRITALQEQQK